MFNKHHIVIDTNVFISALRSQRGASFLLMSLVGTGVFKISLSVPLVLEYEAVAKRLKWPGKPSWHYIADILDYLCLVSNKQEIHFLWRPREKDPKDDMVIELAVASHCNGIVTYNKKDFADASSFGLNLFTPKEFLEMTGELK